MGIGDVLLGGNPVMDQHPTQGRIAILLCMLHATETGVSSSRVGLWLMCAFTVSLEGLTYQELTVLFSRTGSQAHLFWPGTGPESKGHSSTPS